MGGRPDGNRQDNRQRGNAAQLLEKYKSMARDAQLGGDRVQTEYYLQFADHYFRVLGDSRSRFEDQNRGRNEDGDSDSEDEDGEMVEAEAEAEADDRPQRRQSQGQVQNRGRDRDREDRYERQDRPQRGNGRARDDQDEAGADERIAFDALPPAIGANEAVAPDTDSGEETPKPRRRARRPRADDSDAEIAPAA